MRVLLVEDNEKLGRILCTVLTKVSIETDWAKNAEDAFDFMHYSKNNLYDVIVLDWMLPGKSGPEICAALRGEKYGYHGGILFLTARDAVEDRVTGLEAGGDDYLPKPFENAELIARLHALGRRKNRPYVDDTVTVRGIRLNRIEHTLQYEPNNLSLQSLNHQVSDIPVKITLSPREFAILDLLVINFGKVIPRETIIDTIWGMESDITSANLDSYIYLLRKKLQPFKHLLSITLNRGVGYKLDSV